MSFFAFKYKPLLSLCVLTDCSNSKTTWIKFEIYMLREDTRAVVAVEREKERERGKKERKRERERKREKERGR